MPSTINDYTKCFALTYRPSNGIKPVDEARLEHWLNKHADQWEIYEELAAETDDERTRHLHGRVLLKKEMRWDKIKVSLINWLRLELAQKKVLQQGIKHLYDNWDYAAKECLCWSKLLEDEDGWTPFYADPEKKTSKKKNAQVEWYLRLVYEPMREKYYDVTIQNCTLALHLQKMLEKLWVTGEAECPKTKTARRELHDTLMMFIMYRCQNPNEESGHTESDAE